MNIPGSLDFRTNLNWHDKNAQQIHRCLPWMHARLRKGMVVWVGHHPQKQNRASKTGFFFGWRFLFWVMYWEKRHAPYCISCIQVGEVVLLQIIYLDFEGKVVEHSSEKSSAARKLSEIYRRQDHGTERVVVWRTCVTLLKIEHIPPMDDGKSFPSNLTGISLVPWRVYHCCLILLRCQWSRVPGRERNSLSEWGIDQIPM